MPVRRLLQPRELGERHASEADSVLGATRQLGRWTDDGAQLAHQPAWMQERRCCSQVACSTHPTPSNPPKVEAIKEDSMKKLLKEYPNELVSAVVPAHALLVLLKAQLKI